MSTALENFIDQPQKHMVTDTGHHIHRLMNILDVQIGIETASQIF